MEKEIITVAWTDDIDDKIEIACRGDLAIIKRQVINNIAQLWRCKSKKNLCYVVTRIDPGPELVIVAGQGSGLVEFAPEFLKVAKRSGARVRTHVQRKGLIRLWNRLGLTVDEYILRG